MTGIIYIDKAIKQDIVEINYGLDYGSTSNMADEELEALYISINTLPKYSGTYKAKMLNKVRTASERTNQNYYEVLKDL